MFAMFFKHINILCLLCFAFVNTSGKGAKPLIGKLPVAVLWPRGACLPGFIPAKLLIQLIFAHPLPDYQAILVEPLQFHEPFVQLQVFQEVFVC